MKILSGRAVHKVKGLVMVFLLAGPILWITGCSPSAVLSPKTVVERAIEARSASDIAEDNRIVLAVNATMAKIANIDASTDIYEQRLLVTGVMGDREDYETLRTQVLATDGINNLYWHVISMSQTAQQSAESEMLSWAETLALDAKVSLALVKTAGVADVNYRVAADPESTVYLLGRARSAGERDKAIRAARSVEGVRKLVDYIEVRP